MQPNKWRLTTAVVVVSPAATGTNNAAFSLSLDLETRHTFMLETLGDTMRPTSDGKPISHLQPTSIAHPTKSKVEFGSMGKDSFFEDLKIWNAELSGTRWPVADNPHNH